MCVSECVYYRHPYAFSFSSCKTNYFINILILGWNITANITTARCCNELMEYLIEGNVQNFHTLKRSTSIHKTSFPPKPFLGHKISHKFLSSTSFVSLSYPSLSVSRFRSAPSNSPPCLLTPFSFYSSILLTLFINNTHTQSLSPSVSLWRTEASVWELTGGGFKGLGQIAGLSKVRVSVNEPALSPAHRGRCVHDESLKLGHVYVPVKPH